MVYIFQMSVYNFLKIINLNVCLQKKLNEELDFLDTAIIRDYDFL